MHHIDAHQHFWKVARGDYRWMTPELEPLCRDFEPRDLVPHLAAAGIGGTVLVQAADSVAETEFLLELAAATDFVLGVVGWVDFDDPDRARLDIDLLAGNPYLKGVRPMIQDIEDVDWMLREQHGPVYLELARRGLVFDALVKPPQLPNLLQLVARHPGVPMVVDHGAKPTIGTGSQNDPGFATWCRYMRELAAADHVAVKLSGLATETEGPWTAHTLAPYVDHLLDCFGPERILWGSDWPVLTLAGDYPQWWSATGELLAALSDNERERILGANARALYCL